MTLLEEVVEAVRAALAGLADWGLSGTKAGQHHSDLAADAAALAVLERAGVGVLSEESGLQDAERPLLVVLDPLDGSTNAAQGIPWFARWPFERHIDHAATRPDALEIGIAPRGSEPTLRRCRREPCRQDEPGP